MPSSKPGDFVMTLYKVATESVPLFDRLYLDNYWSESAEIQIATSW